MASGQTYKEQLPKWQAWTFERMIALGGGIAGIAALFVTFFGWDHLGGDWKNRVFVFELLGLSGLLAAYIAYSTRRKLHRYAQAIFYLHYINHILRDHVAQVARGKSPQLDALLEDIVDATAHCFSVLIGRRCRCTMKEVRSDRTIVTVVRDRITATHSPDTSRQEHRIEENTDFENLWLGRGGCIRFFLCNNLVALWKNHNYKNSSFKQTGDPEIVSFMGVQWRVRWPLPYKASIVWPIRYVPDERRWPALDEATLSSMPAEQRPFVWGFLCIDSKAMGVFDEIHAPELGASIADAIFTLLQASQMQIAPSGQSAVVHGPAWRAPQHSAGLMAERFSHTHVPLLEPREDTK
jgi:hypothetical protein